MGHQVGKTRAPDGGWGWLVVLASFLLQTLTMGITYTFGVIYVEFIEYFQQTESATAWIGSIQPALMYFTGLLSGPLIQRFGWKIVVVAGSLISSAGLCLSYFATNIYILYVTYGAMSGLGFGFMYVTSMAVVQHYFDSRRALATGIAVAGSGVGTLCFSFFTQFLLDSVGWRVTVVIEGCITLVLGIGSASLLRPLPTIEGDEDESGPLVTSGEKGATSSYKTFGSDGGNSSKSYSEDSCSSLAKNLTSSTSKAEKYNHPLCESDLVQKDMHSDKISDIVESRCCSCCDCANTFHRCNDQLKLSLFKNPRLVIFSVVVALFSFGYHVPYSFTPARAIDVFSIPAQKASFLVSCMGIANVVSRLVFGWFGDKSAKVRFYLIGSVLILCGVDSLLSFVYDTFPLLLLYSALFGAFSGCFVSLYPVVMVDLMGLDVIEYTVGLGMAFSPLAFLTADPLSGLVINAYGYNPAFLIVGVIHVLGGLLFLSIKWLPRRHYPLSPGYTPDTTPVFYTGQPRASQ